MGDCGGLQQSWPDHLFLFLFFPSSSAPCHSCHFGFVPFAETKPETRYRQAGRRLNDTVTRQDSEGALLTASRPALLVLLLSVFSSIYISLQSAPSKLFSHEERFADTESGLRRIFGKMRTIALCASSVQAAVRSDSAL